MSNTFIRNCAWGYSCDKKWTDMVNTDTEGVKFCGDCQREVYSTEDLTELAKNISLNRCIHFSNDLIEPRSGNSRISTGMPMPTSEKRIQGFETSSNFDGFDDDTLF
jgi:hypothetical protein